MTDQNHIRLITRKYILLLIFLLPGTATCTTYYVSQQGNNSNPGTSWSTAWKNLQHAGDTAKAGDTVIIRKGANYYYGLTIKNSGTQSKPITFRGEHSNNPPIISGATHQTNWEKHTDDIWKAKTNARPIIVVEDGSALLPASSKKLEDGHWFWDKTSVYYRPTSGNPKNHAVWRTSHGGGISVKGGEWIIIKDIECWLGGGACISLQNSNNIQVDSIKSTLYWHGIDIGNNSNHNLIKNCVVQQNRSGIYIRTNSSFNTIDNCKAFHNGNLPTWSTNDRAGIAIGASGINLGNIIENCDIANNGGPNSDPGLIAFQAPQTIFRGNHVHDNYSSGIFVAIHSDNSLVINNVVENNGKLGVQAGYKGIAGLSIRRSHTVRIENNTITNNHVSSDSRWVGRDLGPAGGLDIRGLPDDNMRNIQLINNITTGTIGGPNLNIGKHVPPGAVTIFDGRPAPVKTKD